MIHQLQRTVTQLEGEYARNKDSKLLQQKAQILDRISKLRGLDQSKSSGGEEDGNVTFEDKINAMSAERRAELAERVKKHRKKAVN